MKSIEFISKLITLYNETRRRLLMENFELKRENKDSNQFEKALERLDKDFEEAIVSLVKAQAHILAIK